MAFQNEEPFDLQRIQKEFNISSNKIRRCGLSEAELKEIYDNYTASIHHLRDLRTELMSVLNSELPDKIHSVRGRIKAPDHLIEKIIRNKFKNPKKYGKLNIDNYNKLITDLVGFRIIILDKRDWRVVHNALLEIFQNLPERYAVKSSDLISNYDQYVPKEDFLKNSYHAEKPVVYLTGADDVKLYEDPFLNTDRSKLHYRSLHYIIRYSDIYFEIQVRTLFEEGWLEFDHRIKYPYDQNNKKKDEFLSILNSLVTAADRLIAFYDENSFQTDDDKEPDNVSETADTTIQEVDTGSNEPKSLRNKLTSIYYGR